MVLSINEHTLYSSINAAFILVQILHFIRDIQPYHMIGRSNLDTTFRDLIGTVLVEAAGEAGPESTTLRSKLKA